MAIRREIAAMIFLPWLFDFISGQAVMSSLAGALIWGIAVLITTVKQSLKDPTLQKRLSYALFSLSGAWLCLWGLSLSGGMQSSWDHTGLRFLTVAHASLLAAGFGMVLVLMLSSSFWLIKQNALKKKLKSPWLPSLESLSNVALSSARGAFWFWAAGLFFAILTALLRWRQVHEDIGALTSLLSYEWLSDPKVLLSMALLIPLGFCRIVRSSWSNSNTWRYRLFVGNALLFVLLFFVLSTLDKNLTRHEAIRWFVR